MSEREDLKKKLLAKYEHLVDTMLENLPISETLRLSDLERATGDLGAKLMQETLQSLVVDKTVDDAGQVTCPACGGKSHKRGTRRKHVISRQGEIEVERHYYVCRQCQSGFFPPRPKMGAE